MALTDLQKAQNKAAFSVRKRAHTARRREMDAALSAIESLPEFQKLEAVREDCQKAFDDALARRNERERELYEQIEKIKEQIEQLRSGEVLGPFVVARKQSADAFLAFRSKKEKEVAEQFPDMNGDARWSDAAWTPPQKVQDAMEEARRTAVVEPKKLAAAKK